MLRASGGLSGHMVGGVLLSLSNFDKDAVKDLSVELEHDAKIKLDMRIKASLVLRCTKL